MRVDSDGGLEGTEAKGVGVSCLGVWRTLMGHDGSKNSHGTSQNVDERVCNDELNDLNSRSEW